MKRCGKCGAQLYDQDTVCTYCGSAEITDAETTQQGGFQQVNTPVAQPVNNMETAQGSGNIIAGAVGAFLFSIIGGLLYFVIYQLGVIAGICGLIIFVLANFGYNLFAKPGNKNSLVGLVVSIIAMIAMIYLAEYFCISFEIFQIFKDQGITIFDAINATPNFLAEPSVKEAFIGDLGFAYLFGGIASLSNIINIFKARKTRK